MAKEDPETPPATHTSAPPEVDHPQDEEDDDDG